MLGVILSLNRFSRLYCLLLVLHTVLIVVNIYLMLSKSPFLIHLFVVLGMHDNVELNLGS